MNVKILAVTAAMFSFVHFSEALLNDENTIESRGKKKKIVLFVYFADIIVKKIFVFKLIYAFLFWLVVHKAGYFLAWFISYLKDQKKEYVYETDHLHYGPHHHYQEYGPSHKDYGPPHSYGPPQSYGSYKRFK